MACFDDECEYWGQETPEPNLIVPLRPIDPASVRQALAVNQHVVSKLSELEARLDCHDEEIQDIVEAIRELLTPLPASQRRIGFEAPSVKTKARSLLARKA